MVEIAVHALEGGHGHDGFLHRGVGRDHAEAAGFVVQRLLGDEAFERLHGNVAPQFGRDLGGVGEALGDARHVLAEGGGEGGIGDWVALDGGDGRWVAAAAAAAHFAGDAPADEGGGERDEEDARGPGVGHLAEIGEHGDLRGSAAGRKIGSKDLSLAGSRGRRQKWGNGSSPAVLTLNTWCWMQPLIAGNWKMHTRMAEASRVGA